jgi:hypothetical protein
MPRGRSRSDRQVDPVDEDVSVGDNLLSSVHAQLSSVLERLSVLEAGMTAQRPSTSAQSSGVLLGPIMHPAVQPAAAISAPMPWMAPVFPTFSDDGDVHPITFLEDFEHTCVQFGIPEVQWLSIALRQLQGHAKTWASAFRRSWSSWDVFSRGFQDMFWSHDRQDAVELTFARDFYDRMTHGTMTAFFLMWKNKLTFMSSRMSDETFLRRISHLYPANVEDTLLAANVKTAESMLSLLRGLDEAASRRRGRESGLRSGSYADRGGRQTSNPVPSYRPNVSPAAVNRPMTTSGNWRDNSQVQRRGGDARVDQGRRPVNMLTCDAEPACETDFTADAQDACGTMDSGNEL